MTTYNYTITTLAVDNLDQTIRSSAIITSLNHISALGSSVDIVFNADLSTDDKVLLDAIVAAHTGVPLLQNQIQPVAVTALPEPQPFAVPAYRTKRNATTDLFSCEPGASVDIDYKLLTERYVTGGEIIIENAQLGDYITASVEDVDGIIPTPYRAALCEAHPVISVYIEKAWVLASGNSNTIMTIDTYPLNAKISAGLYLCINYHAVSAGTTRRIGINYHLTKKL